MSRPSFFRSERRRSLMAQAARVLAFACTLAGCSSHASHEAPAATEPLAECEAYVAAYASCLTKLTGGAAPGTNDRVRALRDTLTASRDDVSLRTELRATCTTSLKQLRSSCR